MASLLIISSQHLISCQPPEAFITNSSISWINSRARSYVVNSTDGATLTPILSREGNETLFVCGFLCDYNGTACVFGVLLFPKISNNNSYLYYARLVWSANRNNPVRANATLQLRQDGGLFLMDSDGTLIWSTSTSTRGKVVAGFKLTVLGNIVLFDKSNYIIWQSFDHPTDTLVAGQMTNAGQKLRSSVSATNWSEGLFTFEVQLFGFLAYIESNPRQLYVSRLGDKGSPFPGLIFDSKIMIFNGALFLNFVFSNTRFMRFGYDGHLRVYHWRGSWLEEADLLTDYIAQFQFSGPGNTMGHCALLNDVFSLTYDYGAPNKTTLFIKVQSSSNLQASPSLFSSEKKSKRVPAIVGSTIGASFGLLLMVLTCFAYIFRRRKGLEQDEEEFLDQIPGMPTRFSYEELTVMTENFSEKLGEGGFGSVFEGTMSDGTKIAVKRLQGFGNVKKSFLAEVATIGSIHHVNLVKLVGFCAEKSHRLLVYEYMANGSLDRWIFHGTWEKSLTWDVR
ncbi:hypothetical protein MTR67_032820 [Solanum verrucosum]|uniref:Uncharacterized protein n=1 Tax=Solanum verrucosum TaxID=315347 RepID=A0AAF0U595_SOLVR|nr:hypothetical protein MTR67_032820 [Solanum verrucosum]